MERELTEAEREYAKVNGELIRRGIHVPREMLMTWTVDDEATIIAKTTALRPMLEAARARDLAAEMSARAAWAARGL